MKKYKFIRGTKYLFVALCFLLSGCIREDLEDCLAGLRLNFEFTLHTNEGNRFGADVQLVRVYCFDETGVLAHIQQGQGGMLTNNYVMNLQLPPGRYTVIAWGGSNEDFSNSFHEGHMNDPQSHDYENGVTIGKTTLEDFRVFLNYGIADDFPEDILPVIDEFDDLYFGGVGVRQSGTSEYMLDQVEVRVTEVTERSIELIRNTNVLKVTVTGLEFLQPDSRVALVAEDEMQRTSPLQVWASARNGRYKYDNSIGEYARMMRYHPVYRDLDNNAMVVDIKTMRLDVAKHKAEPVYLTIQNPVTGAVYPQQPIDVVNTLLQARNRDTGEYIYNSQEDFDKIYEHPIDIVISSNLQIQIFIQGWEVITVRPEI